MYLTLPGNLASMACTSAASSSSVGAEEVLLSRHRETGETTPFRPTPLTQETGLIPSVLHCEMDALAVSSWLIRQGRPEVKVLELRTRGREPLRHEQSVWTEPNINVYAYGIHYVALSGAAVYDLQSVLEPGIDLAAYLMASFPDRSLLQKDHWPNDLRAQLRFSRDFLAARYSGFKDFPELTDDPLEKRPPLRTVREILQVSRARRQRSGDTSS